MKKIKIKAKVKPLSERIKNKLSRWAIIAISLVCSVLYVLISLIASNIESILKPYLIEIGAPKFVYSSFTFYAAVFIVIGYINKNIIKKQIDMESDLDLECIDENDLEEIKKLRELKLAHAAEIARKDADIASKDTIIEGLMKERQGRAEMSVYNNIDNKENKGIPTKAQQANAGTKKPELTYKFNINKLMY